MPNRFQHLCRHCASMARAVGVANELERQEIAECAAIIDRETGLPELVSMNAAMRALLERLVADVESYGLKHPEADARFEPESAIDARALLESAPCQFCGEPIAHHDRDCATKERNQ